MDLAWLIFGSLLTVSLAAIAILAGMVVLKSLFLIAAELSLLIFLAQSYCAAPGRNAAGNSALKSLIVIGLIYITYAFVQSLYVALRGHLGRIQSSRGGGWSVRKILLATVFVVFAIVFLAQIYLVVMPVIGGLCVWN